MSSALERWLFEHAERRIAKRLTANGKHVFFKQLRDFQFIDRVHVEVHPRFKQSELSGDEWRVSAHLQLFCKGLLVVDRPFAKVEDAAAFLPATLRSLYDLELNDERVRKALDAARDLVNEGKVCMQPGCAKPATATFRLKREFVDGTGIEVPPDQRFHELRRAFCNTHKHRGDQSFEDCDENYEPVEEPRDTAEKRAVRKRAWVL